MDEKDITLAEYKIVVDLIKHQHQRFNHHMTVFLVLHGALVGWIIEKSWLKNAGLKENSVPIILCVVGILLGLVWLAVLRRIAVDTDMRWTQMRSLEKRLNRVDGLAIKGNEFFKEDAFFSKKSKLYLSGGEEMEFPKGISGCLAITPVKRLLGLWLPLLAILLYAIITLMVIWA